MVLADTSYLSPLVQVAAWFLFFALLGLVSFKWVASWRFVKEQPKSLKAIAPYGPSLVHACATTYLGYLNLAGIDPLALRMDNVNTQPQINVMCLSLGYFLYDMVYILLMDPSLMWIIHHGVGISALGASLYSGYMGNVSMIMLFYGEFTNPIHIPWRISKLMGHEPVFRITTHLYSVTFIVMRCLILPAYWMALVWFFVSGKAQEPVPVWVVLVEILSTLLGIVGSFIWSKQIGVGYLKFLRKTKRSD